MAYPANPQAFEASRRRKILDGSEYDKYFPASNNENGIIKRDGSVKDTVKLMSDIVLHTKNDTAKIAKILEGTKLYDTCSNVWNFCFHFIQYKLDEEGKEQLRRPARAWNDRKSGIDCDCYSVFISQILHNLQIPHKFRITKYNAGWQHVYIIVPTDAGNYITIDPVLDQFDKEKQFTDKMDYTMDAKTKLSGVPIEYLSGLGLGEDNQDLLDVINGTAFDGLGETPSEEAELASIKRYLINTRDAIAKNPQLIILEVGNVKEYLKMLDYAIQNWDNPAARAKALDVLEQNEEKLLSMLHGVDGDDDELGKKNKADKKAKKSEKKAKRKEKKEKRKKEGKKFFKNLKDKVKKGTKGGIKLIKKTNPILVMARKGIRAAVAINLFGLATKGKTSKGYEALKKLFVDKFQGKEENLKKAVERGAGKKQLLAKKGTALTGNEETLGDPATLTMLISAAVPIAKAVASVNKATGEKMEGFEGLGAEDEPSAGAVKLIIDAIKSIFSKKENADDLTPDEDPGDEGDEGDPGDEDDDKGGDGKDKKGEGGDDDEEDSKGVFQKIGDFAKENPLTTAGIGVGLAALTGGIIYGVTKSNKKKTLSGTKKTKSTMQLA